MPKSHNEEEADMLGNMCIFSDDPYSLLSIISLYQRIASQIETS